jgi:genome maintenance exonuclease 1
MRISDFKHFHNCTYCPCSLLIHLNILELSSDVQSTMDTRKQNTQPLPHYYAKSAWENGIGYLVDSRGIRLPGITSILKATKSPQEKAQLSNWRQRVGTSQANWISRTSRDRGTLLHQLIKSYFLAESFSCPDSIKPYWENLFPILQDIHDVRLIEGYLFHYYEGYAGRVDCVASYHGIPCVIEFKSADRIKRLYDEPLQLAAYCGALNRQYGVKYGVSLNHVLLIATTPDEVSLTWFDPNEVMDYWHKWQQRVAQFWAQQSAIA